MIDAEPIDNLVRTFARLLSAVWTDISAISQKSGTGSYLQDWLQANWEMIVEAGLLPGTFLEVYGEGADCNNGSSRVYRPDALATHAVYCVANSSVIELLTGREVHLGGGGRPLEELVAVEGTWYARKSPFNCALIEFGGEPCVLELDRVTFCLGPAIRG